MKRKAKARDGRKGDGSTGCNSHILPVTDFNSLKVHNPLPASRHVHWHQRTNTNPRTTKNVLSTHVMPIPRAFSATHAELNRSPAATNASLTSSELACAVAHCARVRSSARRESRRATTPCGISLCSGGGWVIYTD